MQINEYQKKAHATADYPACAVGAEERCNVVDYIYPVMGLAEEAGEVAGKFAKAIRDEGGIIDGARRAEIIKELGDVCWFVSEIATCFGISLEEIMCKNLEKLESRRERGVIHGSGDNR